MITINIEQAVAGINAILMRIERPQALMEAIGYREVARVQKQIRETKVSPNAQPWAPWRPSTEASRIAKGNAHQGLLWDSGALLHSFSAEAHPGDVEIGTPMDYAPYLQSGTAVMAARPFLGWGDGDVPILEVLAATYLATGVV